MLYIYTCSETPSSNLFQYLKYLHTSFENSFLWLAGVLAVVPADHHLCRVPEGLSWQSVGAPLAALLQELARQAEGPCPRARQCGLHQPSRPRKVRSLSRRQSNGICYEGHTKS